jgi:peptide/nickel transport system substrate-binding protein
MAWAYTEEVTTYPFDSARANELLDQVGFPRGADGNRFTVTLTHASFYARLAEAMREQLRQVGINLELESMDFNAAVEKVFIKKAFDLGIAPYCNGPDPEIGVRRAYISTNIGPIPFSNGAGYQNPQVDQLLDQAAALTDRAERATLYAQLQQVITADLPYFWIIDWQGYRAHRVAFQGFRYSSGPFLEQAWTSEAAK